MSNKYLIEIDGVELDFYRIGDALGFPNLAHAHAAKKILYAGKRGHKNYILDLEQAKESIDKAIAAVKRSEEYSSKN